jgi:hypothetical protein
MLERQTSSLPIHIPVAACDTPPEETPVHAQKRVRKAESVDRNDENQGRNSISVPMQPNQCTPVPKYVCILMLTPENFDVKKIDHNAVPLMC